MTAPRWRLRLARLLCKWRIARKYKHLAPFPEQQLRELRTAPGETAVRRTTRGWSPLSRRSGS